MSRSPPLRHRPGKHLGISPWREYPVPILDLIPAVPYPSNLVQVVQSVQKGKRIARDPNALGPLKRFKPYSLCPRATDGEAVNLNGWKPYSDGHGLAIFAA